jgi:hypothetical protein
MHVLFLTDRVGPSMFFAFANFCLAGKPTSGPGGRRYGAVLARRRPAFARAIPKNLSASSPAGIGAQAGKGRGSVPDGQDHEPVVGIIHRGTAVDLAPVKVTAT